MSDKRHRSKIAMEKENKQKDKNTNKQKTNKQKKKIISKDNKGAGYGKHLQQ